MFANIPRPAFGRASQHLPLPPPKRHRAEAKRKQQAKTAAELVRELPNPGESLHCLMTGSYDLTQVIAAVVNQQAATQVRIATLCFSKRNAAELASLLESKRIGTLTLLVSAFFKGHNKELYEWFTEQIREYPGCRLAASRSHCKVVTFDFGSTAIVF